MRTSGHGVVGKTTLESQHLAFATGCGNTCLNLEVTMLWRRKRVVDDRDVGEIQGRIWGEMFVGAIVPIQHTPVAPDRQDPENVSDQPGK